VRFKISGRKPAAIMEQKGAHINLKYDARDQLKNMQSFAECPDRMEKA